MLLLFATSVLCGIVVLVFYRLKRWSLYEQASRLPGPPTLPFLGNTLDFTVTREDMMEKLSSSFESYPSIYRLWFGPHLFVFVEDPDFCKTILVTERLIYRSPIFTKPFKGFFGTGLITAPPEIWRGHRKIIETNFNTTCLQQSIEVIRAQSKTLIELMEVHQDGAEFEVEHFVSLCILDILSETMMDVKLDAQNNQNLEFQTQIDSLVEITADRFLKIWLHPDLFFRFSELGAEERRAVKHLRGYVRSVMDNRRNEMSKKHPQPNDDHDDHDHDAKARSIQRKSLLGVLMDCTNDEKKLSDEDVIDEMITIMGAGIDTSSTTMSLLMLMLATHPEVQQKVYEEVIHVCGGSENYEQSITMAQLNSMTYLERVIKETLRLFPVVSFVPRQPKTDLLLGVHSIPRDTKVTILLLALHRNKRIWPDPLKFEPDRFLPEEVAKRHPYAYLPFGGGPRKCIGWRMAMMSLKIICATVIRKYVVTKNDPINIGDIKMKLGISLKPCKPITIGIKKRS